MIRRLIVLVLMIPAVLASAFVQIWLEWVITGRLGDPWCQRLLEWASREEE